VKRKYGFGKVYTAFSTWQWGLMAWHTASSKTDAFTPAPASHGHDLEQFEHLL
jgi:hypothetical protein